MLFALAALLLLAPAPAPAQQTGRAGVRSSDDVWRVASPEEVAAVAARGVVRPWIRPERFAAVTVDEERMSALLATAPREFTEAARATTGTTLELPRPDGTFERFLVEYSPVMEPELEAWMALEGFPMRTYKVVSLDQPATWGRIDFGGPSGFHGVIRSPRDGMWYIDPYFQFEERTHAAYWRRDLSPTKEQLEWECLTDAIAREWDEEMLHEAPDVRRGAPYDLRVYRYACAATGEYTAFHGGTAVAGQAAVVTMTNRINEIYERDLAVRLVLVANNQNIIYTNSGSDPYTDGDAFTMLGENRTTLASVIGNANFDAGHVVGGIGSGGVAGEIGNICQTSGSFQKAEGATTRTSPVGDAFDIDFTAHELGHQFGGQHTWNYCGGGSGHGLSLEPGSGITIMGYAGLCGADDLGSNSIAMFHLGNVIEMEAYISGTATCNSANYIATGNSAAPTVDAGANYTIPANTPFELTALNGTDTDGDSITYAWEQFDDGQDGTQRNIANSPGSTTGPIYRTFLPDGNATWSFPRLSTILAGGTYPAGERIVTVARTMKFRVTVRDNNAAAGRTGWDNMTITTAASPGFAVTSPNGGESLPAGANVVTWNVANTASSPISTATVDVFLSTDGGLTYPTTIATGVANDGSESLTLPNIITSTARLKIKGGNNIFYDISDSDFSILGVTPLFEATGTTTTADSAVGFANGNGFIEPDEEQVALTVEVENNGSSPATGVTGTLSSLTGTVTISSAGPFAYPDMATGGGFGSNGTPFTFDVSPAHVCGTPINLRLTMASNEGSNTIDFSIPTGEFVPATPLPEEGFEGGSLPGGWTTSAASGPNDWGVRTSAASAGNAAAGTFLASFEPPFADVVDAFLVTPAVTGAEQLTFFHAYDVEQENASGAYDGLVLEITTNGGANWARLDAEITTGGYTHTADGGFGSPLDPGDACWSGSSPSFPAMNQVVVDLSAYTSDTIQVRFRYTEDNCCSAGESGWFIDRVEITGGSFNCFAVPVELTGYVLE